MTTIPKTHKQDYFASAYIESILSIAEYKSMQNKKDYGIDFHAFKIRKRKNLFGRFDYYEDNTSYFKIQLKSTREKSIKIKNGILSFKLRVKNYLDLLNAKKGIVENFLFLIVLPNDEKKWIDILNDHSKIYQHMYYFIPNSPKKTRFRYYVTIKIPISNRIDIDFLKGLV